jgi:sugar O-acyltransferase (sialic acid O-acetyltransferase NeuD family)
VAVQLLIFPFNGNGIEALDCINGDKDFLGFIDDTKEKQGNNIQGFKVYDRSALTSFPDARILAVPGSPSSYPERKKIIDSLGVDRNRFISLVHPRANISARAEIGSNVLIMGGVWISAGARIGDHVCILPNSVIHHDSIIGEYTLVGSNVTVAGHTSVGRFCYIGSGTSIINNIEVGDYTLAGMGSNIIKSIKEHSRVVGNPARSI